MAEITKIHAREILDSRGNPTVEAAHISTAGKGIKSSDDETIPLSHEHHAKAHSLGEVRYLFDHLPLSILRTMLKMYAREIYRTWKHETTSYRMYNNLIMIDYKHLPNKSFDRVQCKSNCSESSTTPAADPTLCKKMNMFKLFGSSVGIMHGTHGGKMWERASSLATWHGMLCKAHFADVERHRKARSQEGVVPLGKRK